MRIWLACFGVLFAIAELYQWMKHLTLPLPIYILGGAFLAIASNYNKLRGWQKLDSTAEPPPVIPSVQPSELSQSLLAPQPPRSISFTIRRPVEQNQRLE